MEELLKNSYKMSIIYSVIFIVMGLLLFLNPNGFVEMISYLIGALFLVYGITNIIKYAKAKELTISKFLLVLGVILSICGIFLIINPTFIGKIVPTIIGVCLIINSLEKLLYLRYTEEKNSEGYIISLVSGIVALIAGVFLLFNPLSGTLIVTQIIGVIIIVYAVMDLIEKLKFKNVIKRNTLKIDKKIKIIDEK